MNLLITEMFLVTKRLNFTRVREWQKHTDDIIKRINFSVIYLHFDFNFLTDEFKDENAWNEPNVYFAVQNTLFLDIIVDTTNVHIIRPVSRFEPTLKLVENYFACTSPSWTDSVRAYSNVDTQGKMKEPRLAIYCERNSGADDISLPLSMLEGTDVKPRSCLSCVAIRH